MDLLFMPWTMQILPQVTVKRLFSEMKFVLSDRRTSMKNELLNAIIGESYVIRTP